MDQLVACDEEAAATEVGHWQEGEDTAKTDHIVAVLLSAGREVVAWNLISAQPSTLMLSLAERRDPEYGAPIGQ